jgi:hypothetical protein
MSLGVLLIGVPLISCDSKEKDSGESGPSRTSTQADRGKSTRQATRYGKEAVLKTLEQKLSSRKKYAYLAADVRQMLKTGARDDFDELMGTLGELNAWDRDFGIEIMRDLDPSLRPLAMEWISSIAEPTLRYHTKSGALGLWIALDPKVGLAALASVSPAEMAGPDPSISRRGGLDAVRPVTSFEGTVWRNVGRVAGDPAVSAAAKEGILDALSTLSPELQNSYCGGVGGAIDSLIGAKQPVDFERMTGGLDGGRVEKLVASIANGREELYQQPTAVRDLLGFMDRSGVGGEELYQKIGSRFAFDSFAGEILEQGNLSDDAKVALAKGWSARRPEDAVQQVVDRHPELLPAVFEGWVESDFVDAENWIRGAQDGAAKTAGVRGVCDFLIKKGRTSEVANWLGLLPEGDRATYQEALRASAQ